jgi:hypothetical protein
MRKAIKAADKRHTVVGVDGVATDAYRVETADLCAVGLRTDGSSKLTVLLIARSIEPDTLKLALTTELPAFVGDPQAL